MRGSHSFCSVPWSPINDSPTPPVVSPYRVSCRTPFQFHNPYIFSILSFTKHICPHRCRTLLRKVATRKRFDLIENISNILTILNYTYVQFKTIPMPNHVNDMPVIRKFASILWVLTPALHS